MRTFLMLAVAMAIAVAQPALAEEKPVVEYLNAGKTVPPSLPFSEAVRVGDLLFLSGQIGIKPGTLELVPGGIQEEGRQALANIRTALEANGYSMRDVVKCTVMLADVFEWAAFNEVYKVAFTPPYPARSAMGTGGLAMGARVEIECIAAKGK